MNKIYIIIAIILLPTLTNACNINTKTTPKNDLYHIAYANSIEFYSGNYCSVVYKKAIQVENCYKMNAKRRAYLETWANNLNKKNKINIQRDYKKILLKYCK